MSTEKSTKTLKVTRNQTVEKYLENANIFAVGFATVFGTVTMDDIRNGYPPRGEKQSLALQTNSRAVFRKGLFEQTGNTVMSSRPAARGGRINVYRLA